MLPRSKPLRNSTVFSDRAHAAVAERLLPSRHLAFNQSGIDGSLVPMSIHVFTVRISIRTQTRTRVRPERMLHAPNDMC